MEKYWPNLNSQGHREYLWEHEYEKHGYCFTEFRNHVDYFQTALAIATDIGDVKNNMRLSSGSKYLRYTFFLEFCNSYLQLKKANLKFFSLDRENPYKWSVLSC